MSKGSQQFPIKVLMCKSVPSVELCLARVEGIYQFVELGWDSAHGVFTSVCVCVCAHRNMFCSLNASVVLMRKNYFQHALQKTVATRQLRRNCILKSMDLNKTTTIALRVVDKDVDRYTHRLLGREMRLMHFKTIPI